MEQCAFKLQGKPEPDKDGFFRSFWLDPAREFVVVRYAEFYDDQEFKPPRMWVKLDISYQQDAIVGWVPREWEYVFFATRGEAAGTLVTSSTHAHDVQCELNPDIPEEEFTITFPVGTIVNDYKTDTAWIQGEGDKRLPIGIGSVPKVAATRWWPIGSNVDWGQDLRYAARYLHVAANEHPGYLRYLLYFGQFNPSCVLSANIVPPHESAHLGAINVPESVFGDRSGDASANIFLVVSVNLQYGSKRTNRAFSNDPPIFVHSGDFFFFPNWTACY